METVIVLIFLAVPVALTIKRFVKNAKEKKCMFFCDCDSCAQNGNCPYHNESNKDNTEKN